MNNQTNEYILPISLFPSQCFESQFWRQEKKKLVGEQPPLLPPERGGGQCRCNTWYGRCSDGQGWTEPSQGTGQSIRYLQPDGQADL